MSQILMLLLLLITISAVGAFAAGLMFSIAAAGQVLPEKKAQYSWNPLNRIVVASNLTEKGKRYRKIALWSLAYFVAVTAAMFISGSLAKKKAEPVATANSGICHASCCRVFESNFSRVRRDACSVTELRGWIASPKEFHS